MAAGKGFGKLLSGIFKKHKKEEEQKESKTPPMPVIIESEEVKGGFEVEDVGLIQDEIFEEEIIEDIPEVIIQEIEKPKEKSIREAIRGQHIYIGDSNRKFEKRAYDNNIQTEKMIYVNQDFYSNFSGSMKSGDTDMTSDILVSEISDLVAFKDKDVIDMLNKVAITTKPTASDAVLIDNIVNNLSSNKKLSFGLAYLIADNNDLLTVKKQKKSNASGSRRRSSGKSSADGAKEEDWSAVIDKIGSGIQKVGDNISDKTAQEKLASSIKEATKTKVDASPETKARKKERIGTGNGKKVLYWGIGLLVAGGVSWGVWYMYKKNKAKNAALKLAAGGPLVAGAVPPLPISPAIHTVPPPPGFGAGGPTTPPPVTAPVYNAPLTQPGMNVQPSVTPAQAGMGMPH
jgi:hypothetical protein